MTGQILRRGAYQKKEGKTIVYEPTFRTTSVITETIKLIWYVDDILEYTQQLHSFIHYYIILFFSSMMFAVGELNLDVLRWLSLLPKICSSASHPVVLSKHHKFDCSVGQNCGAFFILFFYFMMFCCYQTFVKTRILKLVQFQSSVNHISNQGGLVSLIWKLKLCKQALRDTYTS